MKPAAEMAGTGKMWTALTQVAELDLKPTSETSRLIVTVSSQTEAFFVHVFLVFVSSFFPSPSKVSWTGTICYQDMKSKQNVIYDNNYVPPLLPQ